MYGNAACSQIDRHVTCQSDMRKHICYHSNPTALQPEASCFVPLSSKQLHRCKLALQIHLPTMQLAADGIIHLLTVSFTSIPFDITPVFQQQVRYVPNYYSSPHRTHMARRGLYPRPLLFTAVAKPQVVPTALATPLLIQLPPPTAVQVQHTSICSTSASFNMSKLPSSSLALPPGSSGPCTPLLPSPLQ